MRIKCKVKDSSETKIVLIPQEKFDPIDICGEDCDLIVRGTTEDSLVS